MNERAGIKPKLFDPQRLDAALAARRAAAPRESAPAIERKAFLDFEERFKIFSGRKYCLLTSSGRAALRAGLKALGVGKGCVAGMTNLTHPSAPEAAAWAGAKPDFIEIDKTTLNLDEAGLEIRTGKLDALLLTHMFAASSDMDRVMDFVKRERIPCLEDASQIIGETSKGRPYGSFGEIGVFSLSPYKPVSSPAGKAGVILCDDDALFRRIRAAAEEFGRPEPGVAGFLSLKLEVLPSTLAGLEKINASYLAGLAGIKGLYLPAVGRAAHEFPVLTPRRKALEARLRSAGVPLERIYEPFNSAYGTCGKYPASARYAAQALHLPVYPMMTESETRYVIKTVKEFFS